LTRPDAQLLLPLFVAFVVVRRRVLAWNDVGVLVVPFSCLIGAHYLWRHAYYGYWLPNTYYAKIASHGPWPDLGWRFAAAFGLTYGYFLTLPIVALLWRLVPSSLTRGLGVLVLVYFSLLAGYYCYRVGGDHFEFRIFDPFVPFFSWAIAEVFVIGFQRRRAVAFILGAWAFGYSIAVPAVMMATNDEVPADVVSQFGSATRMRPGPISRALLPGISRIFRWDSQLFLELNKHLVAIPQAAHRQFWRGSREMMRHLRNASLPPMTVTATNIGTPGYFLDAPIVDALGLTDSEIAHHGRALSSRLMAHDLRPPRGYLLERGVNAAVLGVLPNPQVNEGIIVALRELGVIPEDVPWKPYSIALRDGLWLNIVSWDEAWVRRNFREVHGRLFPHSRPRRRE
jgi:hypothetical protein